MIVNASVNDIVAPYFPKRAFFMILLLNKCNVNKKDFHLQKPFSKRYFACNECGAMEESLKDKGNAINSRQTINPITPAQP